MSKLVKEFRDFISRGNVIDLAVGFIIGSAFSTIVKSLVSDIIMPPIGLALGKVDFSNLFLVLKEGDRPGPYYTIVAAQEAGAVTLNYGPFINSIVTFLIIAVALFFSGANRKQNATGERGSSPATDYQRMPLLLYPHSHQGYPLPELHFGASSIKEAEVILATHPPRETAPGAPPHGVLPALLRLNLPRPDGEPDAFPHARENFPTHRTPFPGRPHRPGALLSHQIPAAPLW